MNVRPKFSLCHLLYFNTCLYYFYLCVCESVCHKCACALESQKRTLNLLKLKLQTDVPPNVVGSGH